MPRPTAGLVPAPAAWAGTSRLGRGSREDSRTRRRPRGYPRGESRYSARTATRVLPELLPDELLDLRLGEVAEAAIPEVGKQVPLQHQPIAPLRCELQRWEDQVHPGTFGKLDERQHRLRTVPAAVDRSQALI